MSLEVGQAAEVTRAFSAEDVATYAAIGGHAATDGAVPEPLINALFSYLLGVELPGVGTNYLKQESRFVGTPTLGEALTARVEITGIRPEKYLVDLATSCRAVDGTPICEGRALVYVRDVAGIVQTGRENDGHDD